MKNKALDPSGIPDTREVNEDEKQVDEEYSRKKENDSSI